MEMSIETVVINDNQAELVEQMFEGQFSEVKAIYVSPGKLAKTI